MKHQFWAVGCGLWSGLDCEIEGFGPIMSNFSHFLKFLWTKNQFQKMFENILGSALKSCIE
jgi:hypothetical protein